jgi:hypothetical protein
LGDKFRKLIWSPCIPLIVVFHSLFISLSRYFSVSLSFFQSLYCILCLSVYTSLCICLFALTLSLANRSFFVLGQMRQMLRSVSS